MAPDYLLVEQEVKEELISYLEKYIKEFLGEKPLENENYPKIINEKHFYRIQGYLENQIALYLFTNNAKTEQKILSEISFGGGCINDTIIHLASTHLGFGGVGKSGMGDYHGKNGFDTFTHYKSILKKYN